MNIRHLSPPHLLIAAALFAFFPNLSPASASTSALWGEHGESWNPRSRLPDFSFAGYRSGERPLPRHESKAEVTVSDFGARGDGITDDGPAFQKALDTASRGIIEVPPGRYKILQPLSITRSGIVLRGAGPDRTVLFFPVPLNEIKPNWGATTTGQRTSNYSWSGGFLTLRGSFQPQPLANITGLAQRGDTSVEVNSSTVLKPGQWVEIHQRDQPDNSLAVHLYSGDPGPVQNLKGQTQSSLVCQISRIEGTRIHINRPLRCDLRPEWRPQIRAFEPTVTESGIESLCFEFPNAPYQGHFTELGYNAIAFSGVAHCWVRQIVTRHAESGLFISGCFNTIQDVVLESARRPDRQNCIGHHGISLGGGDNLVTGFDIRARYIHDITVSHHCAGNVCSQGHGVDLSLDHHRYAPYENLFTDIDAGAGKRLWKCGGGADLGKHCGARGTFWNIRAASPLAYPPPGFGPPSMNLVALETDQSSITQPDGLWFETISPNAMHPPNLHQAQLTRRLQANPAK